MSAAITADDLATMRLRDSAVTVYSDKYGGKFVLSKDGRLHGQHAIMDRHRLLKHLDALAALSSLAPVDFAASDKSLSAVSMRESGWVIEAPPRPGQTCGTQYLFIQTGSVELKWTAESRDALRFAREDDARAFMSLSALSVLLIRPAFKEWVTTC